MKQTALKKFNEGGMEAVYSYMDSYSGYDMQTIKEYIVDNGDDEAFEYDSYLNATISKDTNNGKDDDGSNADHDDEFTVEFIDGTKKTMTYDEIVAAMDNAGMSKTQKTKVTNKLKKQSKQ
jgi:hypothetical protein